MTNNKNNNNNKKNNNNNNKNNNNFLGCDSIELDLVSMYVLKMRTGGRGGGAAFNQISNLGVEPMKSDFELLPDIFTPSLPPPSPP